MTKLVGLAYTIQCVYKIITKVSLTLQQGATLQLVFRQLAKWLLLGVTVTW